MDGQGPARAQAVSRRALAAAAAVQLLLSLAVVGRPLDVDEPVYVEMAEQVRRDPLHPGAASVWWEGRRDVLSRVVTSSPLPGYLFAAPLALAGGEPAALRLWLIPVDVACALLLYLLFARFLERPLLPVLAVLVSPGWWLTVPAIQLEKWSVLFGLGALLAAVRGRFWPSAALAALCCLSKHSGVVFAAGAASWLWAKGAPPKRLAGWLALALGPAALHLSLGWLDAEGLRVFLAHANPGAAPLSHRWRAILAFAAGCAPAAALWGLSGRRAALAAAAAGAALYLPLFDRMATTAPDRLLGLLLGACGAAALAGAWAQRSAARPLWLGLGGSALLAQAFVYWSVAGRFSLFLGLALTLALAERLEKEKRARAWAWAGLALSLALGLPSLAAEYAHAAASEAAARELVEPGRRVWFTGHWGFQHAMQRAGARPLEGSWGAVRPGDRVIVPGVNSNVVEPVVRVPADVSAADADAIFPFLTMCGGRWRCQAGFHSSAYGFLPYSFTREPADTFKIVDLK